MSVRARFLCCRALRYSLAAPFNRLGIASGERLDICKTHSGKTQCRDQTDVSCAQGRASEHRIVKTGKLDVLARAQHALELSALGLEIASDAAEWCHLFLIPEQRHVTGLDLARVKREEPRRIQLFGRKQLMIKAHDSRGLLAGNENVIVGGTIMTDDDIWKLLATERVSPAAKKIRRLGRQRIRAEGDARRGVGKHSIKIARLVSLNLTSDFLEKIGRGWFFDLGGFFE